MGYAAEVMEDKAFDAMVEDVQPEHETALTVFNPFEIEPAFFRKSLDRRTENRNTMLQWIKGNLTEGVDYGKITIKGKLSRPSLFKPGAEKISGLLGLRPEYPAIADYERRAIEGGKIEVIILRCLLYSGNQIVAEGTGSRLVSKDNGDINKSIKMALKSGQIDATLRCAGLSEIFTQDIEDMNLADKEESLGKKFDVSPLQRLKDKLSEATHVLHLQRIWTKYTADIKALSAQDRASLIEFKDSLKVSLAEKFKRNNPVQAQPEPEYLITEDQIERIRQIIKPGGTGKSLTTVELDKLIEIANNPNSTAVGTEDMIIKTIHIMQDRESKAKAELEGD